MRFFALIAAALWAGLACAQDWEDQRYFGDPGAAQTLRIISSTDTAFFAPVVDSFLAINPNVSVQYLVTSTAEIDRVFRDSPAEYDLVISSAMDLQFKLANDGYALQMNNGPTLPNWAEWRRSLYAFTSEPAAIVINVDAFEGHSVPLSRQELIQALRDRPETFLNRVGTYDVRESGLGYLFATQDARASDTYWRLMEVFGGLQARLYCCSGDMIDDLSDGTIAVAYNVLGSYASARAEQVDALQVILPADFPTSMMRTALVSKSAKAPALAEAFVIHLLDVQAKGASSELPLPSLPTDTGTSDAATISLGPSLLTYLDGLKRAAFLSEWESAVIQNQ